MNKGGLMSNWMLMGISQAIDVMLIIIVFAGLIASTFTWAMVWFIEWEKKQNK